MTKCMYLSTHFKAASLQGLPPPPNIIETKSHLFWHSQLQKKLSFPQFLDFIHYIILIIGYPN